MAIFEVTAIDLRHFNEEDFRLVRASTKAKAEELMQKRLSVNRRFLEFKTKKVKESEYPNLPKKEGVY